MFVFFGFFLKVVGRKVFIGLFFGKLGFLILMLLLLFMIEMVVVFGERCRERNLEVGGIVEVRSFGLLMKVVY